MMTFFHKEIFTELRNITTIDLAYKTSNIFEKIFWTLIGISGTIWAVYFITLEVLILLIKGYSLSFYASTLII